MKSRITRSQRIICFCNPGRPKGPKVAQNARFWKIPSFFEIASIIPKKTLRCFLESHVVPTWLSDVWTRSQALSGAVPAQPRRAIMEPRMRPSQPASCRGSWARNPERFHTKKASHCQHPMEKEQADVKYADHSSELWVRRIRSKDYINYIVVHSCQQDVSRSDTNPRP